MLPILEAGRRRFENAYYLKEKIDFTNINKSRKVFNDVMQNRVITSYSSPGFDPGMVGILNISLELELGGMVRQNLNH